jgi:hypothetical protein
VAIRERAVHLKSCCDTSSHEEDQPINRPGHDPLCWFAVNDLAMEAIDEHD